MFCEFLTPPQVISQNLPIRYKIQNTFLFVCTAIKRHNAIILKSVVWYLVVHLACPNALAQQSELFRCPQKDYKFSGIPEQTLCEKNPDFLCSLQIGSGTPLYKSSLIGASITGNVCIVGDFEVDAPFVFQNATVKINTGVTISISGAPNSYGSIALGIDNSELFACNGLWKGITLGYLSAIYTDNNSVIEDAETAIHADGLSALFIQSTTFNRNRVGIELVTPFPSAWNTGPLVWTFSGNRFTCDAPLNGTIDGVSLAGIKLNNSYLYTFQTGINLFSDLQYGISAEGDATYIGIQNLIFQRIKRDGIFMEKGNLDIRSSRFENCYEKGINIAAALNIRISNDCVFRWDSSLPAVLDNTNYDGIYIGGFLIGSRTTITNTLFSANFTSANHWITGLNISGGANIGAGTQINVNGCEWRMYAGAAFGLIIDGDFPSESQIDIFNNDFEIQNTLGIYGVSCILCDNGNKHNLDIIGNRFYNDFPKSGWANGITLRGSEGTGNQVSDNHFEPGLLYESYFYGVNATNFKNTKYCANIMRNVYLGFSFSGQNEGTDFTNNLVYGSGMINIYGESWIEDQIHKGNQWTLPDLPGLILYVPLQAACFNHDFALFSEFYVHTPQSTTVQGPGFNPYHPKDLEPDGDIEWWIEDEGTPTGFCTNEIIEPGGGDSKLKRAVAQGTLATQLNNPSMMWQAERTLFFTLKRSPGLEGEHPAYSAFLTNKIGSNIDKFYQVATALDAARSGHATLVSDAQNNLAAIDNLLAQVETADQAWLNAATPAEKESAKAMKEQKLGELSGLLENASTFQTTYEQNLQTALTAIEQTNNNITPASDWETYEKTTNEIFISNLQNGGITAEQKQQIEAIAEICPKYGGTAVYKARGILPDCAKVFDWDDYAGCYPTPTTVAELATVEPRSKQSLNPLSISGVEVFPNPANESITLNVPLGKQGQIRLVDAWGRMIAAHPIVSSQTILPMNLLQRGIYHLDLIFSDGQFERRKVIITR